MAATQTAKKTTKKTAPPVKAAPKKELKKPEPSKKTGEFAQFCKDNELNPKVARAKLRRAGLKSGGAWQLTPEVKKTLLS